MRLDPLQAFFARSLDRDWFPKVPYVPDYVSPCIFGAIDVQGLVQWRPVQREPFARCDLVALATGYPLPDSTHRFFGSHYASPMECRFGHEYLVLDCGAWNDDDFARKEEMLVEHVTIQREHGREPAVPIAWSASGSSQFFGVNLRTGAVSAEVLGDGPGHPIAASMGDFLEGLEFSPTQYAYASD